MDSKHLGDFRSDISNLPDEDPPGKGAETEEESRDFQASEYHQEVNTLKIEKLSNRVTIISVILPCLIIAVLIFVYLDIKERVVDVDLTKKNQVEKLAKQLEEKLNALDVRIAKNRFDVDKKLPELDKKTKSLENQMAKIGSLKADAKTMSKIEKQLKSNAGKDKSTLKAMDKMNMELMGAIKEGNARFEQASQEFSLFKEEFDARLLELAAYEEQISQLNKTSSLLDKKLNTLDREKTAAREVEARLSQLKKALEKQITDLDRKLDRISKMKTQEPSAQVPKNPAPSAKPPAKPVPQLDTGSTGSGIAEETLTQ